VQNIPFFIIRPSGLSKSPEATREVGCCMSELYLGHGVATAPVFA
jgi:hypothetical protein